MNPSPRPWWKSKIILLSLILIAKPIVELVGSSGWAWDRAHYSLAAGAVIGALIAFLRAGMPDVTTGIPSLDKNNPDVGPR